MSRLKGTRTVDVLEEKWGAGSSRKPGCAQHSRVSSHVVPHLVPYVMGSAPPMTHLSVSALKVAILSLFNTSLVDLLELEFLFMYYPFYEL